MDGAGIGGSSLYVRRFRAQYLVPSGHPTPESVKARLDEAAAKSLPDALSALVSAWFSNTDSSIWLVRRLDLEVDVDAAWNRDRLAHAWSGQVGRSLVTSLAKGEDGENVVRFKNRAEYLARFLVDLSAGRAWGKWYYESLDGLRMVPLSAALRTAICNDPETGFAALLEMPLYDLQRVLRVLTPQDAQRVLNRLSNRGSAVDEFCCFQALWETWETAELDSTEEWCNALHLYLGVCRNRTELSGASLRTTTLALLRFASWVESGSTSARERLLAALCSGNLSALYLAAGPGDTEVLAPLIRCPADWVRDLGESLLLRQRGRKTQQPVSTGNTRHTSFGGIFLLLSFLDALPLEETTFGWPDAEGTTAVALLRFLILIKCCGQVRSRRAFSDPLVRELVGIDPSLSASDVANWQARLSKRKIETFLRKIAAWQRECEIIDGQTLVLARVPLPAGPLGILLDCQRGVWLFAGGYGPRIPGRLVERLSGWLSQTSLEARVVLSDEAFVNPLNSAFPFLKIEQLHSLSVVRKAEEDRTVAEILARLDKIPDDVRYLALPRSLRNSRSVDLALSVAAQGIMRAFAWRLPGFSRSSLPYLYRNFLDFPANMEEEAERQMVCLGKPPLHLVLGMTGLARQNYRLSWLDQRPFALFPEG